VQNEQEERNDNMAKKEFTYRGKTLQELQAMSLSEFAKLVPTRARRSLTRTLTEDIKKLLKSIEQDKKNIKTHLRDTIILPNFVGKTIRIHNGKEFISIIIQPEMIGHFLGEFSLTRKRVAHSAPGIGATRSSASVSVK